MSTGRQVTAIVRPARPMDREAVERLLAEAGLPLAGVAEHFTEFLVATTAEGIVGAAGVERYGASGLLRSVVVRADARGRGLGQLLTLRALDRARAAGIEDIFLLTTSAERFFERFGFRRVARERIPAEMRDSAELKGACPDDAIVMECAPARGG